MAKPFIIAELGSNPARYGWNFDWFCRAAKGAGADAVKAQIFRGAHFPNEEESKTKLEFPRHRIAEYAACAHRHGLRVGASVFDAEAMTLTLAHLDFIKLAAREQSNVRLINAVAKMGLPRYRSIDVWNITNDKLQIKNAEAFIHFGTVPRYPLPMAEALFAVCKWVMLCKQMDLRRFGWSSHTRGWLDCWLAAKMGAGLIEKHLAISKLDVEAGHSLLPDEFKKMVERIKC